MSNSKNFLNMSKEERLMRLFDTALLEELSCAERRELTELNDSDYWDDVPTFQELLLEEGPSEFPTQKDEVIKQLSLEAGIEFNQF